MTTPATPITITGTPAGTGSVVNGTGTITPTPVAGSVVNGTGTLTPTVGTPYATTGPNLPTATSSQSTGTVLSSTTNGSVTNSGGALTPTTGLSNPTVGPSLTGIPVPATATGTPPATTTAVLLPFETSTTWTVPLTGVTSVNVLVVGGGGGGGVNNTGGLNTNTTYTPIGAGGGSGGDVVEVMNIPVTPGQTFQITVGGGGTEGGTQATRTDGKDGQASSVVISGTSQTILANGGKGGGGTTTILNTGLGKGAKSVATYQYSTSPGGGVGGNGATLTSVGKKGGIGALSQITGGYWAGGGGGGGISKLPTGYPVPTGSLTLPIPPGKGGGGGNDGGNNDPAGYYAGGGINGGRNTGNGGGGGGVSATTNGNGGTGGSGVVIIQYTPVPVPTPTPPPTPPPPTPPPPTPPPPTPTPPPPTPVISVTWPVPNQGPGSFTPTGTTIVNTPITTTVPKTVAYVTQVQQIKPNISTSASTTTYSISTIQYITTPVVTTVSYPVFTPVTQFGWYTTSNFLSSNQFYPLALTQYSNFDKIQAITGGINASVSPNYYTIFASTGTDLIALTGDVNLNNISVALSTVTTALFSNISFTNINKLVLDPNTNYLYVIDAGSNLIHQFNASGFLTNDNILANKLIYIKSIGGYGTYDDDHLFNNPQSLVINDSNIFVLDSGNSCIKRYDTDFNWITTYRLFRDFHNNYPIDIAADSNNNIHVLTNTGLIYNYNNVFFHTATTITTLPALENAGEYYTNIVTSMVNADIFYLITNLGVYKKFYSSINDTIGNYLFYRFNVVNGENIVAFTSLVHPVGNSDTNIIFSKYNGAGKFGLYADNINLSTVLVADNFDVYPLSSIQIDNNEYLQNWVFNKAIAKLIVNHTRLRDLIFSKFLYEPDDHNVLTYHGTRYMTPGELQDVSFDQNLTNFIGSNEIFQNIIVNRSLKAIYDAQVSILNMLQSDIRTAPDLNIPVYIN